MRSIRKRSRAGSVLAVAIESLESRTHFSNSIPINTSTWTTLGPSGISNGQTPGSLRTAGKVLGVAPVPSDPNTIYVATTGGVWKTTNAGTNWSPLTDGQASSVIGSIAVAPSNPNVIYAGTGEATNELYSNFGRGVLKSTDGGNTWALTGSAQFDRRSIGDVVIDPNDSNIVYVAVSANNANANLGNTGIWKSTNGGASWTNTTGSISPNAQYSDLKIDPADPTILFCAVGTPRGEAPNGVYRTTNSGGNWSVAGDYALGNFAGRTEIAIAPSNDQILYSAIAGSGVIGSTAFGSLFALVKSTDGGGHWSLLSNVPNYLKDQGHYSNAIAVDPSDPNKIYLGGGVRGGAFYMSTDGGTTFVSIESGANGNGPHDSQHAFAFDQAGRLLAGNDGGIFRLNNSTPGSINWVSLAGNLNDAQLLSVAPHPTDSNIALAGSLDNNLVRFGDSTTWTRLLETDSTLTNEDQGSVAFSPGGGAAYVVSPPLLTSTARLVRRNDSGGSVGSAWANKSSGISISNVLNVNYLPPLVADQNRVNRLVVGTDRVYESTNGGDSWTARSTVGSSGWSGSLGIDSVAVSASDINVFYAITTDSSGNVFVEYTSNRGSSWSPRTISGVADGLAKVIVDPNNSSIAYVVRDHFGGGKVYRTTDAGASWSNITGNLSDAPAYTIALGGDGTTLYIGTDTGVYTSSNIGSTWSKFAAGLPNVQVRDLEFNGNFSVLNAATNGRGLWQIGIAAEPPTVTAWSFFYDTLPQKLSITFSKDIGSSFDAGDIAIIPTYFLPAAVPNYTTAYSSTTKTATITFSTLLPDNWYHATLTGAGVSATDGGGAVAGNPSTDFFFLLGDAGRNVFVGSGDFNIFVTNYGKTSGGTHSTGDFNFDGRVDTIDFAVIISQFGKLMSSTPPPVPGSLPAALPATVSPTPKDDDRDDANSIDALI